MKKNDIYVVGFPKSGNTWLARLLAEATDSVIDVDDKKDIINNVDNQGRKGNYKIYKLHDSINSEEILKSNKVVYIIRDVRDVLVSGFFFNNPNFTENQVKNNFFIRKYFNYEINRLNYKWQGNIFRNIKRNSELFIKSILKIKDSKALIGNWSEHVQMWTNHPNSIVVRYEDLLISPKEELIRVLKSLNIDVEENTLINVIENQSFEKKKAEFIKKGDKINAKFMRSGVSQKWKLFLNHNLLELIEKKHKLIMSKYLYCGDSDE